MSLVEQIVARLVAPTYLHTVRIIEFPFDEQPVPASSAPTNVHVIDRTGRGQPLRRSPPGTYLTRGEHDFE